MSWKTAARRVVKHKAFGVPAAALLGRLGRHHRRSRVLELCGYMPNNVPVRVPRHIAKDATFHLSSAHETDQIAWRLWTNGWSGFEQPLPDLFAAAVRTAHAVIDVGANSGLYAVAAASVSKSALIHAFEPLPNAFGVLKNNIAINNFHNRIEAVEAAVADENGSADLFVPSGNETLLEMSASLNSEFRPRHSQVLNVKLLRLDDYVADRKIARVDIIKVDVESQEHRVLAGAANILQNHRPLVFLEVLDTAPVKELEAIRHEHGYVSLQLRSNGIFRKSSVRIDAEATNQLLCPAEKFDAFCAMAAAIGYTVHAESQTLLEVKDQPVSLPSGLPFEPAMP